MGNIHLGKARNCSNMRGGVFKSPLYLSIREIVCQEEQIIIGKGIHYLSVQLLESDFLILGWVPIFPKCVKLG